MLEAESRFVEEEVWTQTNREFQKEKNHLDSLISEKTSFWIMSLWADCPWASLLEETGRDDQRVIDCLYPKKGRPNLLNPALPGPVCL